MPWLSLDYPILKHLSYKLAKFLFIPSDCIARSLIKLLELTTSIMQCKIIVYIIILNINYRSSKNTKWYWVYFPLKEFTDIFTLLDDTGNVSLFLFEVLLEFLYLDNLFLSSHNLISYYYPSNYISSKLFLTDSWLIYVLQINLQIWSFHFFTNYTLSRTNNFRNSLNLDGLWLC